MVAYTAVKFDTPNKVVLQGYLQNILWLGANSSSRQLQHWSLSEQEFQDISAKTNDKLKDVALFGPDMFQADPRPKQSKPPRKAPGRDSIWSPTTSPPCCSKPTPFFKIEVYANNTFVLPPALEYTIILTKLSKFLPELTVCSGRATASCYSSCFNSYNTTQNYFVNSCLL